MKKWLIYIAGITFLVGLMVPVTSAQLGGGPPWPEQEQRPAPKEKTGEVGEQKRDELRKEDIKEILETMRIWKMTKTLALTEEQSLKIFPKIHESERTKEESGKKRMKILMELNGLLKDEKPDQAKITEMLNALDKIELEVRAQEDKFKEELKIILSPVQQAKFYIFMKDFEEDVKRMIAEVRGFRRESMERMGEKEMPKKK